MTSSYPTPPAWKAYRALFAEVQKSRGCKLVDLVEELNKDAKTRCLPKCTYSVRAITYWIADPRTGMRPRTPQIDRVEHLHLWLSEQIDRLGKTSDYAARLAAIAPPPQTSAPAGTLPHDAPSQPGCRTPVVYLGHCPGSKALFAEAFGSGGTVLYVTIMSETMIEEFPLQHLPLVLARKTTVQLLTWDPDLPKDVIEAYRLHLGQYTKRPSEIEAKVRDANKKWTEIATQSNGLVQVRRYLSCPTLRALILLGKWALVELVPYRTSTNDRPALFLPADGEPELYSFFESRFTELWAANK